MRQFLLVFTFFSFAGWSQPAQQQVQQPIVVQVQMPPTPHRDFLGYLQSLGPLIAALVAVGVGLMQRNLQKQNLKQNLYTLRHGVYRSVAHYWRILIQSSAVPPIPDKQQFFDSISHATFLFGPEVVTFLEDYYAVTEKYCLAFQRFCSEQRLQLPTDALAADFADVEKQLNYFAGPRAVEVFGPYLNLGRDLPWYARLERDLNALTERLDQTVNRIHR
jgi:hypothetical protein